MEIRKNEDAGIIWSASPARRFTPFFDNNSTEFLAYTTITDTAIPIADITNIQIPYTDFSPLLVPVKAVAIVLVIVGLVALIRWNPTAFF